MGLSQGLSWKDFVSIDATSKKETRSHTAWEQKPEKGQPKSAAEGVLLRTLDGKDTHRCVQCGWHLGATRNIKEQTLGKLIS